MPDNKKSSDPTQDPNYVADRDRDVNGRPQTPQETESPEQVATGNQGGNQQQIDRDDPQQQENLNSAKNESDGEPTGDEAEGLDQSHSQNPAEPRDAGNARQQNAQNKAAQRDSGDEDSDED